MMPNESQTESWFAIVASSSAEEIFLGFAFPSDIKWGQDRLLEQKRGRELELLMEQRW